MVATRYPAATWLAVPYAGEAGALASPLGWVLHVTCMDGSPWSTFKTAQPPNRRFSHLWVAKDGHVEQYAPLTGKSWAQDKGNATYWSVETEGQPDEPLTDAQIQALAEWHVWSGTDDHVATASTDRGISCHYLGGADWGGHTCPDPAPGAGPRSHQRAAIVARAQQIRSGGDDMQLSEIAGWDVSKLVGLPPDALNFQTLIARVYSATVLHPTDPAVLAAAIAKFLPAGSGVDAQTLADAVATELSARLKS